MHEGKWEPQRIEFANLLRGIAAFSVVWLHLSIHYWYGKDFVFSTLGIHYKSSESIIPWWANLSSIAQNFSTTRNYFDFGIFGVALFFLISGFVIPISLKKLGPLRFLITRVIRIYPVYISSLGLWILLWLLVEYFSLGAGRPDINLRQIAIQASLFGEFFDLQPIDLISWTLQIEVKFYLIAAVLYGSISRARLWGVYLFATLIIGASAVRWYYGLHPYPWMIGIFGSVTSQLITQLGFICYIFCGYFYWLLWERKIDIKGLISGIFFMEFAVLFALFACDVKYFSLVPFGFNQVLALMLFAAAMKFNMARGWLQRMLERLAQISYPMYATHLVSGWAVLSLMDIYQIHPGAAQLLSFGSVILAAWIMHFLVEKPSQYLIARMSRG